MSSSVIKVKSDRSYAILFINVVNQDVQGACDVTGNNKSEDAGTQVRAYYHTEEANILPTAIFRVVISVVT
jgi:hypothetical protein